MRMRTILVGCTLLLACTNDRARGDTRLRATFVASASDHGIARFIGFRDVETDTLCSPATLSDGGLACLPSAWNATQAYADDTCTTLAARVTSSDCVACSSGFLRVGTTTCSGSFITTDVVKRGSALAETWSRVDGRCSRNSGDVNAFAVQSAGVEQFARLSLESEKRGGLTVRRATTRGGARALIAPQVQGVDVSRRRDCHAIERWLPVPTGFPDGFSDDQCMQPLAATLCAESPFAFTPNGCLAQLGEPTTAGFSMLNGVCTAALDGFPHFAVHPLDPATFAKVFAGERKGSGRLSLQFDADPTRQPVVEDARFFDSQLQIECEPDDPSDASVCLPVTSSPPAILLFADAACTEPVVLVQGGMQPVVSVQGGTPRFFQITRAFPADAQLYSRGGQTPCAMTQSTPAGLTRFSAKELTKSDLAEMTTFSE